MYTHLRCKKKRRKRYGSYDRRGKLLNQISIDDRPAVVGERKRQGDWELNTIIGMNHKQAIVTMTECVLRLKYIREVENKTADSTERAMVRSLKKTGMPVLTTSPR